MVGDEREKDFEELKKRQSVETWHVTLNFQQALVPRDGIYRLILPVDRAEHRSNSNWLRGVESLPTYFSSLPLPSVLYFLSFLILHSALLFLPSVYLSCSL
jgi:hypothetical protein